MFLDSEHKSPQLVCHVLTIICWDGDQYNYSRGQWQLGLQVTWSKQLVGEIMIRSLDNRGFLIVDTQSLFSNSDTPLVEIQNSANKS